MRFLHETLCVGASRRWAVLGVWVLLGLSASHGAAPKAGPAAKPGGTVEYNRDIRPILSDQCFHCHGPDKNARKAKLRLDVRDEAIARKAFVPGKPDESELVKRLFSTDPEEVMPPPASHKTLTPAQKEMFRRWIAAGAVYQPHWAYVKPVRLEPPVVRNRGWVRNDIDSFVLADLESRRIKPSSQAERRDLLRRLYLDLIGLPPTPEQVAAFVASRDPRAYETAVDGLLASVHFGERMAVGWLDTARFADTVGYHGDQNQRVFPYRDYVINAFNRNKPFDRFTTEQLAGDLLPSPTTEQLVATGFNRLNMMTREGGAQAKEYLAKYAADRVRTVGNTWLGSTVGCSECHDHKFDPFTMRDFYSMAAFFADVKQWGVYSDYDYTPNPDLKGWSNDHPFPPEIEVESEYLQRRLARLRAGQQRFFLDYAAKIDGTPAFKEWWESSKRFLTQVPSGWLTLSPLPPAPVPVAAPATNAVASTNLAAATNRIAPPALTPLPGGAWRLGLSSSNDEAKIEFALPPGSFAALKLERLPTPQPGASGSNVAVRSLRFTVALQHSGQQTNLAFYRADADHKEPRYSGGQEIIGLGQSWRPAVSLPDQIQTSFWLPEPPVHAVAGDTLLVTLKSSDVLSFRLSVSPFASEDPLDATRAGALHVALNIPSATWSAADRALVASRYLLSTQAHPEEFARFRKLEREVLECRNGRAYSLVTAAWKPSVVRVLPRGNWQNESGEVVQPAPPRFLTAAGGAASIGATAGSGSETRLTRLDLARWLTSRENPLTARVYMNRLWKQFFGNGLSVVVDDVGAQGEWPANLPLLDWLAVEFMDSGWDVKHMVKLMVMSATYRQSASLRPELRELDPQNRWLASQNPRRLEAEFVRDNALFVAGLLDPEVGGPSAHPYQPAGYYEALQFPDRDYVAETDERQYRRGLYTHWQRTFLHPMLANFDAPAREECTASRNVSNTPQQALTLLNDPTFVEAARVLATRILACVSSADTAGQARIELAYGKVLGRPPRSAELASLKTFLATQRGYYRAHADEAARLVKVGFTPPPSGVDPGELAAWTTLCRVLLNTHESITRY